MSASICQRPSSINRRDKRLGNGHARSRRHRIKCAVGPIRSRSFSEQANYLDALNASRGRAFFFAVMGCSGLALTGTAPI